MKTKSMDYITRKTHIVQMCVFWLEEEEVKIIDKPLEWLTPYENNPRNNDKAVEPVANSIREFGFKVPIVATKDGEIINGHTRYKAARFLKLKTVPVR